jgi:hypothetical protein
MKKFIRSLVFRWKSKREIRRLMKLTSKGFYTVRMDHKSISFQITDKGYKELIGEEKTKP